MSAKPIRFNYENFDNEITQDGLTVKRMLGKWDGSLTPPTLVDGIPGIIAAPNYTPPPGFNAILGPYVVAGIDHYATVFHFDPPIHHIEAHTTCVEEHLDDSVFHSLSTWGDDWYRFNPWDQGYDRDGFQNPVVHISLGLEPPFMEQKPIRWAMYIACVTGESFGSARNVGLIGELRIQVGP